LKLKLLLYLNNPKEGTEVLKQLMGVTVFCFDRFGRLFQNQRPISEAGSTGVPYICMEAWLCVSTRSVYRRLQKGQEIGNREIFVLQVGITLLSTLNLGIEFFSEPVCKEINAHCQ
jgi:hypothetical protein